MDWVKVGRTLTPDEWRSMLKVGRLFKLVGGETVLVGDVNANDGVCDDCTYAGHSSSVPCVGVFAYLDLDLSQGL